MADRRDVRGDITCKRGCLGGCATEADVVKGDAKGRIRQANHPRRAIDEQAAGEVRNQAWERCAPVEGFVAREGLSLAGKGAATARR